MNRLTPLLAILLLFSCNKKSNTGPDVPLQGQWEMTDSYTGNSNGTESHQKVKFVFYTYTATDSLNILFTDILISTKLSNLTSSTYVAEDSQLPYTYIITGNKMEIKHPCDEGCRWLFSKVK